MKLLLFLFFVTSFLNSTLAQKDSIQTSDKIYQLKYVKDISLSVARFGVFVYGNQLLWDREPKNPDRIPLLKPEDVWWFDRGAAQQDPDEAEKYLKLSDQFMNGALLLPALMYIDPKVREIWYDYALLFVKAHSISSFAYVAGALPIRRLRPLMYNPNVSLEDKMYHNTTNSFFSGHTSMVTTSSFFMVKVYFDLHPEAKNRLLWYGLATIPSAITGYCRYKGGKHFPTDILTGFTVGALTGILVPEFNKSNRKKLKVSPALSENYLGIHAQINLN